MEWKSPWCLFKTYHMYDSWLHDKTNKMSSAPNEDSDQPDQSLRCVLNGKLRTQGFFMQTGWMPRLICIFAGCTGHFVGFVTQQLKSYVQPTALHSPAKFLCLLFNCKANLNLHIAFLTRVGITRINGVTWPGLELVLSHTLRNTSTGIRLPVRGTYWLISPATVTVIYPCKKHLQVLNWKLYEMD